MKITYTGIKKGTTFRIVSAENFKKELNELPEGKYRIVVTKYRKDKSLPQLGYYYACVLPLSWQLLTEAGWELSSLAEVDIFWKGKFANKEVINRHTGEVMDVPALKRDMTTTEMMTFVDAVRNYCAEYLGGNIPDPETNLNFNFEL